MVALDGLRPKLHPTHMTIDEAVAVARDLDAPQAFLTHMTYQVDYDAVTATLPANVRLAHDGLRVQW